MDLCLVSGIAKLLRIDGLLSTCMKHYATEVIQDSSIIQSSSFKDSFSSFRYTRHSRNDRISFMNHRRYDNDEDDHDHDGIKDDFFNQDRNNNNNTRRNRNGYGNGYGSRDRDTGRMNDNRYSYQRFGERKNEFRNENRNQGRNQRHHHDVDDKDVNDHDNDGSKGYYKKNLQSSGRYSFENDTFENNSHLDGSRFNSFKQSQYHDRKLNHHHDRYHRHDDSNSKKYSGNNNRESSPRSVFQVRERR